MHAVQLRIHLIPVTPSLFTPPHHPANAPPLDPTPLRSSSSFHFTPIQQVFIDTVHSPRLFQELVLARSLHFQRVERYLKDGNDRHEI